MQNSCLAVLLAGALLAFTQPTLAQETGDGGAPEAVIPGNGDGDDESGRAKPITNLLGRFLEVVAVTRDLVEFEGWIREKARVEIFDRKRNRYVQLQDTKLNREIDGAGLRLYYVDRMQGFMFIKYEHIEEIEVLRDISQEEEEAWQAELDRQIEERRQLMREKQEAERLAAEEAAAAEAAAAALEPQWEEPEDLIPPELERGYQLLKEFPPPTWGEDRYRGLRRAQLTDRRGLTIDERRFVESFISDWKPAFDHQNSVGE